LDAASLRRNFPHRRIYSFSGWDTARLAATIHPANSTSEELSRGHVATVL